MFAHSVFALIVAGKIRNIFGGHRREMRRMVVPRMYTILYLWSDMHTISAINGKRSSPVKYAVCDTETEQATKKKKRIVMLI